MANSDELSELYGGPLTDIEPSMYAQFEKGLNRNPNEQAIVVMHQASTHLSELTRVTGGTQSTGKDCLIWTYEQLRTAALKIVEGLTAKGVRPGDTVMTFLPNGIEWAVMFWACTIMKLPLVPLDPSALSAARSEEIQNYMTLLKPRVMLVHQPEGLQHIDDAIRKTGIEVPRIKICSVEPSDSASSSGWCSLANLGACKTETAFDAEAVLNSARDDDPDRPAVILFTSGTSSGKPKGCPRHVRSMTSSTASNPFDISTVHGKPVRFHLPTANFRVRLPCCTLRKDTDADSDADIPSYQVIASILVTSTWSAGGTVVMSPPGPTGDFNASGVLDAVEQHSVHILLLLPFMLYQILEDPSFSSRKLDSLGEVWIGADIITKDILARMGRAFPGRKIFNGHGMTESAAVFRWPFQGIPLDEVPYFGNISPLGKPGRGVRVSIRDPQSNELTRRGEPGELCLSGDMIIKRYLQDVNSDAFFTDAAGHRWFRTGDFGMIDQDGIIFILGRIKDVIKRSGLSITAAALENCVSTFVGSTAAVVGVPHPTLGAEPFAIVKEWHGKNEDEVKANVLEMFGKDYALAGATSLAELQMVEFPVRASLTQAQLVVTDVY